MILLGLDTSLGACSVALYDVATGHVLPSGIEVMQRGHAEALGPMVEAVFARAKLSPKDIGGIVVVRGPGTFTGLRIGLAFAKGVALARNITIHGVDSLWATAAPHFGLAEKIVVAHRAGATGRFYVGCFDGVSGTAIREHALLSVAALQSLVAAMGNAFLVGSGIEGQPETWPDAKLFLPHAAKASVGGAATSSTAEPLYLRPPDAKPLALQGKTTPMLRLARLEDGQLLSSLHGQSFETAWTPDMLRTTLASGSSTTLIAENRGEACGFIQAQVVVDEAEILTLCVSPMLRRHGLAMLLLGGLIADLKMRNIKSLFLEVASGNNAARGLYTRAGFSEMGRRKNYYASGDDAITMTLALQS